MERLISAVSHNLHSLLNILKTPLLLLMSISFSWLVIDHLPAAMALVWLVVATVLDLITGLMKAWTKNQISTSYGFRKTVVKVASYIAIVLLVTIFVNLIGFVDPNHKYDLALLINALIGFMTFVELFSVCENLVEAFPNSPMTKYFVLPLMKLLKGKLESANPLNKDVEDESKT